MQTVKSCYRDSPAANLAEITSFVKCPVCMELLKNPVELRCNHMFCVSCIERYGKGNNYNCPVCKVSGLKRSAKPAQETAGALKLLENVCKKFKEATAPTTANRNASLSNPDKSVLARKCKLKPKTPPIIKHPQRTNLDVISKESAPKIKKVTTRLRKSDEKAEVAKTPEIRTQTKPEQNKKVVVQISKQDQIVAPYKENVIKWLCNSQNMFGCREQTQQGALNDISGYTKHLKGFKSISQRVVQRRTLPSRQAARRQDQSVHWSMASLQDMTGAVMGKTKIGKLDIDLQMFDTPVDQDELKERQIENIDSNPIVTKSTICRITEEDYPEIGQDLKHGKFGRKRKKSQEKNKDDSGNVNKSMSPDWQRITKISDKVDKIDGIPKKLKLVPTTKLSNGNKDKDKENINTQNVNTQFSTAVASEYGRISNSPEQNSKCRSVSTNTLKSDAPVQRVTLDEILKEIEISKKKNVAEATCDVSTSVNVECNEHLPKATTPITVTKPVDENSDAEVFLKQTQPINTRIVEATSAPTADDIFSLATQPAVNKTVDNVALHTQCEEFLIQFTDLHARLETFVAANSLNGEIDANYNKIVLVHKQLCMLQPKFCNLSSILTQKEDNFWEVITDRSTQTEVEVIERMDRDIQTSPPQLSQVEQCLSPMFKEMLTDQAVQTSPRPVQISTPKKMPLLPENIVMKDTLDFIEFDTQAALKKAEARSGGKTQGKHETLTNRHTEQMPLTAFIDGLQKNTETQDATACLNETTKSMKKKPERLPKSARRQLYQSPGVKTPSPHGSPIGTMSKRVKPLILSDSEEEQAAPIVNQFQRNDLSVTFDSESQGKHNDVNTTNVDKYLENVWNRIQEQEPKRQEQVPERDLKSNALQQAIKTNTQDLIAKCELLMSNRPTSQHTLSNSTLRRTYDATKGPTRDNTPMGAKQTVSATSQLVHVADSANLLTDSIFGDMDDDFFENFATPPSPGTSSRDKPKSTLHNIHSDLIYRDSNSSILTNILDENPHQGNAIKVLQDVQICKLGAGVTETKEKPTHPAQMNESDEDLIYSTPETTPTKTKLDAEVVVLAPPPDFRDELAVCNVDSQEKRRTQIWNVSPNTLKLSPIQASATQARHALNAQTHAAATPRCAPNKVRANVMRTPIAGGIHRRVTSTPYSKPNPIRTSTPNLNSLFPLCTLKHASTPPSTKTNFNQVPITNFLRKDVDGAPASSPNINSDDDDNLFVPSAARKVQAVVACTRLDKSQMIAVNALAKNGLAKYSSAFDSSVTHMVVATNDANCAKDHTIKYVRAVAAGVWVVNSKWVQDSLLHKKLQPEEFYEVHDVSGQEGPKRSRLYRSTKPLFEGFKIYVSPPFELITPGEVEDIITSLGGVVVPTSHALLPKEDYICVIIAETGATQDEEYLKYQDWAEKLRVATVEFEWLTRSIGAYELLSLRRFALCTDNTLCELGYPENLLENVLSCTQND